MVTDSRLHFEHSITYRLVTSLSCTPETDVSWCVNYASIKTKRSSSFYWVSSLPCYYLGGKLEECYSKLRRKDFKLCIVDKIQIYRETIIVLYVVCMHIKTNVI